MKNIYLFLPMLLAAVLLNALTAFSSSGPFGTFGPNDYSDVGKSVDAYSHSVASGTGPYGAFGYMGTEAGVVSKLTATPGGSGPYGAFDIYGMIPGNWSTSAGNRAECIMIAKNCLSER